MPKKNPLTPSNLKRLAQQLHDTRMSIWSAQSALNHHLCKDTKLVERASMIYDLFEELENDCKRDLGTKYEPPTKIA
jgi:hypothetical protein